MNDDMKRVILVAGVIIGVPIAAGLAWFVIVFSAYLGILAAILAGAGTLSVVLWLSSKVWWAWNGPRVVYEKDTKPARALVGKNGGVTILPHAPYPMGLQTLNFHQDSHSRAQGLLPEPEQVVEEEPAPTLRPVPWHTIVTQIPHGEVPLGVGLDRKLRTGPRDRLKTCLTLGKSGSGKTVSVAGRLTAAALGGAALVVIDPHAYKADSLARKIAPLAAAFWQGLPIAIDVEQILAHLALVQEELNARKQSGLLAPELLIVIEEYASLYDDPDIQEPLVKLSKGLTREARGFGIYGEFLTQDMSGGLAGRIRRLAQSYVIGRSDYNDAQAILHDSKLATQVMNLAPGAALVIDAYGERELLQQPHITRADIEEAGRRLGGRREYVVPPLPPLPMKEKAAPLAAAQEEETSLSALSPPPSAKIVQMPRKMTPEEREIAEILKVWRADHTLSRYEIARRCHISNNKALPGGLIETVIEEEQARLAAQEQDA